MRGSVPVARRNLFADRRRLAIGTLGVGLAVALILLLQGLWGGLLSQVSAYPDSVGATFFVRQGGAKTLLEGSVPIIEVDRLRSIPDVEAADPVLARWEVLDFAGSKEVETVIGFLPGGLGGPWDLAEGRTVRRDGELVVDQAVARDHGIALGSSLRVADRRFRVVGLSSGTRTFMQGGYLFMSFESAERLFGQTRTATFILVRAADPAAAKAAVARLTGLSVDTPNVISLATREAYVGVFGKPVSLMVLIALVAGILIVALTVYSAILDRLREYGIAKAMGAREGRLFWIVAAQTLMLAALGLTAGFLFYFAGSRLIVALRPQFQTDLTARAVGVVAVAALLMGLLAAIVPTRRIARLDPASVYRGVSS